MPKRIPNLPEAILDSAATLFSTYGYDAVEMKQVAAAAGTSVGNLYNYHPSKPALFLAVRQRWRSQLFVSIAALLTSDRPRREKVLAVLGRIYDDIAGWHGLWSEFVRGRDQTQQAAVFRKKMMGPLWGLGPEEQAMLVQFDALLTDQPSPDGVPRWATLVITATLQLASRYPGNKAENWTFLEELVDKL